MTSAVIAAWTFAAAPAHASDETFSWARSDGAERCPSTETMRVRIAERLGNKRDAEGRGVDAVVTRANGRFTARVLLRDAAGSLRGAREITSDAPDCDPLAAAVVLAVALAIDPESASRPLTTATAAASPPVLPAATSAPSSSSPSSSSPPSSSPSSSSPSSPSASSTSPRSSTSAPSASPTPATLGAQPASSDAPGRRREGEPAPRADRAGEPRLTFVVRPEISLGLLPHVAVGLGLAARVRVLPRLDVAAGSTWSPAARLADGAFSVGLSAGRLGTCVVPVKAPSFELLGCADVLVGATHASALDASVTPAGDRSWIAVSGSALVALRVSGPLLVEVGVDGVVPLVRDTFVSARVLPGDKARNAFQQPAIAGILHFGAGVSF